MLLPPQKTPPPTHTTRCNIIWYIFFITLLIFCYHNSFQASWHFDDVANIILNTPLHLKELRATSLKQTFFAYPDSPDKLFRPISNLSIGINWFLGQNRVFGYHLVNFIIHVLTSLFLYQTCLLLLSTPRIGNNYQKSKFFIAALAATFWAINPIQTQAITYIVQRMAAMATLFTIIGIWCYLKARCRQLVNKRAYLYFLGTCLSFLLAIGSKENAVVFPASILLVELLFFQQTVRINKQTVLLSVAGFILILIFTLILVGPDFFQQIISSYDNRDFTLSQRVLTEARIVVYYLSLLLYPSPLRLSLTHDVQLSASLFSPPTTLSAILILMALTILPFFYHKKFPFLSFAILFFLLNHIIESTFIPLELFFEHRNYLPSLFLFLPLAVVISITVEKYQRKNKLLSMVIVSSVTLLIILLCMGTIARNAVWQTEKSLWTDSLTKAPNTARSYNNLAHVYLFQDKNYKKAFELSFASLDKYTPTPWKSRVRAHNIMALSMNAIGNYKQALIFYDKALSFAEKEHIIKSETLFLKTKTQWLFGQKEAALQAMANLVEGAPHNAIFLQRYGEMLITADKTTDGLIILKNALAKSSLHNWEYKRTLLDLSLTYSKLDSSTKSHFFLAFAQRLGVPPTPAAFCQLEISLHAEQTDQIIQAWKALLSQHTWPELIAILEETSPKRPTLPLDYPRLRQYAIDWLATRKKI
jgi:protein O-mannosyl-transferase